MFDLKRGWAISPKSGIQNGVLGMGSSSRDLKSKALKLERLMEAEHYTKTLNYIKFSSLRKRWCAVLGIIIF